MPDQVPPGRAGRLWLRARIASARRSAELLERKRQLLRRERDRLAATREVTRSRWEDSCSDADRWGARAALLGGASVVPLCASSVAGRATVEVPWRNTMGVLHPDMVLVHSPALGAGDAAAANGAIAPAAAAYRAALEAGVEEAAAQRAYSAIDAELRATERRLRAIERRRIPMLEEALRQLELRLDELEREERVVTRWAKRRLEEAPRERSAASRGGT